MPEITVKGKFGGTFKAYAARPQTPPPGVKNMPGIVLIQEIFGVNDVMRRLADEYARQGYIVLCPDLFWRFKPGIVLTDKTQKEWDLAFALFQKFDQNKGTEDLASTMDELRRTPGCSGKVGAVETDRARSRLGEFQHQPAERGLAAARFAHNGERIALADVESDAVKRPHGRMLAPRQFAQRARHRKVLGDVAKL